MKKYEYRPETDYFVIDPLHIPAGLAAASSGRMSSVCISATDYRSKNLTFDPAVFAGKKWIRRLILDENLSPVKDNLDCLYDMADLEELTIPEWIPLDFSRFRKLTVLVLSRGTSLKGLDKLHSLGMLYLINWKNPELPDEIARLSASEVRIDASSKLVSLERLFIPAGIKHLTLKNLPAIKTPDRPIKINKLEFLNVENTGWADFSWLYSKSLAELELFTKFKSLEFIRQLPGLKKLYIWECIDGDMNPVLSHQKLEEIYFDKNRKHYTHKETVLQSLLGKKIHKEKR